MSKTQGAMGEPLAAAAAVGMNQGAIPSLITPTSALPAAVVTVVGETKVLSEESTLVCPNPTGSPDTKLFPQELIRAAETRVFQALEDPEWDWRTLRGLAESTQLPSALIQAVLEQNCEKLKYVESAKHGLLVCVKHRKLLRSRSFVSLLDKTLDYLSFGKRRRIV